MPGSDIIQRLLALLGQWKGEVAFCCEVVSSPSLLSLGHILLPFVMSSMLVVRYFNETLILKIKVFYFEY